MVYGDLLKSDCDVIIHGCNCFQTMGSGIAKQIRKKYPEAYEADLNYGIKGDKNKLGTYSSWTGQNYYFPNKQVTVVNLYTQYRYGTGNDFEYGAFTNGLRKVFEDFPKHLKIGIPKIGAGLAGGDWELISEIISKLSTEFDRNIQLYELDEVIKAYKLLKKNGFNVKGIIHYHFEMTFLFDTIKEAEAAFNLLEKNNKLIYGYWYSWDQWMECLKEEDTPELVDYVISDFSDYL